MDPFDFTESKAALFRMFPWLWRCVMTPIASMWHGCWDAWNLSKSVQICKISIIRSSLTQPVKPRLEMEFCCFNSSVHPIKIRRVRGRLRFLTGEVGVLTGDIEIAAIVVSGKESQSDYTREVIPSRSWFAFVVRQMIDSKEAKKILATSTTGNCHMGFGLTEMSIYLSLAGGSREHPLKMPDHVDIDCQKRWRTATDIIGLYIN